MLSKITDNEINTINAIESFNEALRGYFEALEINKIERFPLCYAEICKKIGKTYMCLSKMYCGEENYLKAINYFKETSMVYLEITSK